MTETEIDEKTGFARGEKFTSEQQVREYFTVASMEQMGFNHELREKDKADEILTQDELDEMAAEVIEHHWHCDYIGNLEKNEHARESLVGKNISIIAGVEISGWYPVINRNGTITGWHCADEGNRNYVTCDFVNGEVANICGGCWAVIHRDDLTAEEIEEIDE